MAAMAVKVESLHHATESLICSSPRKYYRAYMAAEHWQLRSFISTPEPDLIYYLNGPDVLQLNTATKERETVATLSFSPRCLVAGDKYICCGGEHGDFAALLLNRRADRLQSLHPYHLAPESDPDSRLPLNLDPVHRLRFTHSPPPTGLRRRENLPHSTVTKVGKEIVNCVTLWFPVKGVKDQTYSIPVAVLSNNDHTVSVVSLPESEVLDRLELDDCVNRAIISPDGKLLIAIGDDPYMHVYERTTHASKSGCENSWTKVQKVQLQGQRQGDEGDIRGSFATAFSPSGRYVAVGTQYGQICVYETLILRTPEEDPLLVSFTTSRPNQSDGAVRAIEFSPEPYDLLAWTEHNGRVTVADIRRNFMSRQLIHTDERAEGIERVSITERAENMALDPRLRPIRSDSDRTISDSLSTETERRQLRSLMREGDLARLNQERLTPEETAVLDALQMQRRSRDNLARQSQTNAAQHVPLSWTDLADDVRSNWMERTGAHSSWRDDSGLRRSPNLVLPNSLREFTSGRPNDSLRAYIDERNRDREQRGQQPRRRGSMILAAAQSALERDSQSPTNEIPRSALATVATALSSVPSNSSRLPAIGSDAPSNPWTEIEALYNLAMDPPVDPAARLRVEIEADNRREYRRLEHRRIGMELRNQLRSGITPSDVADYSLTRRHESTKTTGCCWSQDGKILYVGAENGIYEYHVNVAARKFFPSIRVR